MYILQYLLFNKNISIVLSQRLFYLSKITQFWLVFLFCLYFMLQSVFYYDYYIWVYEFSANANPFVHEEHISKYSNVKSLSWGSKKVHK